MASRFAGKTYGRRSKADTSSSSAFDQALRESARSGSSAKTTSSSQKWGKTTFTSTRSTEDGGDWRKRPAEDNGDSLFDDPFGFDSDDEGPSKPKRGMGFKVEADKPAVKSYGSKRMKKDENNDEKDTMKRAPSKTYSRGRLPSANSSSGKSHATSTQLSIDTFATKLTDGDANVKLTISKSTTIVTTAAKNGSSKTSGKITAGSIKMIPKNKFFTSRQVTIDDEGFMFTDEVEEEEGEDVNSAQGSDDDSGEVVSLLPEKFSKDSDFEYDSDTLANLDSGDPEIVFNSPQKRRREAAKSKQQQTTKNSKKSADKFDNNKKNSDKTKVSGLFADSDGSDTDTDLKFSQNSLQSRNYGMKANHSLQNNQSKSVDSISPSKFFPELARSDRSGSVESNGSTNSSEGLKPKKALSLASKLLSLEAERKQKKLNEAPVVRRLLTSPKKAKISYNPRPWHKDDSNDGHESPSQPGPSSKSSPFDADFGDDDAAPPPPPVRMRGAPKIHRSTSQGSTQWDDDVTKVSVKRDHKPLYQVVRHVKQAHECQESGETQDFNDELNYIMEGLHPSQNTSVRALSCLSLAQKCTTSSFRMHLRAHGILDKVFHQLQDAHQYSVLALCTAAVMFLVSRDRFTMELEKGTLQLMLRLLSVQEADTSPQKLNREYQRMEVKMRTICDSVKIKGQAKLDRDQVNSGQLALESLLSLTSRKAGDWFKEDMRVLGGLDHIVDTVAECAEDADSLLIDPSDGAVDQVRKIERCLRVLENVTYMNSENQNHLIAYQSCSLIKSLLKVLKSCENCLSLNPLREVGGKLVKDSCGYVAFNSLLASLRVLLNLTHDNEYSSTKVGQLEGLMQRVLVILLRSPQHVPAEQRFDLLVLGLGLLINMVEHCEHNRDMLLRSPAVCPFDEYAPSTYQATPMHTLDALTKLFVTRYEAAKRIEVEHDEELERKEKALANQKQKRLMANQALTQNTPDPNASGMWRDSGEGLEWVVNEDHTAETEVAKSAGGADSDLDVDVEVLPGSQEEEENLTKALHKAGRHMEDCILAAYVALLIGCIIQGNTELIDRVRDQLPEADFDPMCRMLRKFLGFMNFTATEAISQSSGSKSILRIIEVLEAC